MEKHLFAAIQIVSFKYENVASDGFGFVVYAVLASPNESKTEDGYLLFVRNSEYWLKGSGWIGRRIKEGNRHFEELRS